MRGAGFVVYMHVYANATNVFYLSKCTHNMGFYYSYQQCAIQPVYSIIYITITSIIMHSYPMFNLASTTPTPDAHITTDDNLVYNIHKTRVPADTVENQTYDTPISSTQLPAPSQPSSDRSTIYDDIDPVYEYPASIGKTDSRPLALLPSTASAADMMQLKDSPLLGAQTPCTNAFAGRGNVETSFRI